MVLRKKCEQIELARCECNLPRPTRDTTRLHIEREITDLLPQSVSGIGPPKQSTNPREQLSKGKGFYQIIIRSGVQAEHAILNRIASSEQQHGCFGTACAKRPEHFDPIAARQHPIEYHHVKTFAAKQKKPLFAGLRRHRLEAVALQPARERAGSLGVIFYQ